jgi:hypothetical protein
MLILIKDDAYPRPYRLFRAIENGETVLWSTYLIRRSAILQAKAEAQKLNLELANYIDKKKEESK